MRTRLTLYTYYSRSIPLFHAARACVHAPAARLYHTFSSSVSAVLAMMAPSRCTARNMSVSSLVPRRGASHIDTPPPTTRPFVCTYPFHVSRFLVLASILLLLSYASRPSAIQSLSLLKIQLQCFVRRFLIYLEMAWHNVWRRKSGWGFTSVYFRYLLTDKFLAQENPLALFGALGLWQQVVFSFPVCVSAHRSQISESKGGERPRRHSILL